MIEISDPLALFDQARQQQADAAKLGAKFERLTRKLFTTDNGKEWLRLALAKHNFMGSVFSAEDGMNAATAAYRDGVRSVFSDILNAAAAGIRAPQPGAEDD